MQAYFIHSDSKGTTLELRETATPQAGPGQLLVRVRAASLNRGEFIRAVGLTRSGAPKPAGSDGAGEVEGSGQRVMGRLPGSFADYALMDAKDAIPVPPNLSWEEAAAVPISFLVVYDMLVQQGNLKPGEWLLVTGISSGVGVSALLGVPELVRHAEQREPPGVQCIEVDLGLQAAVEVADGGVAAFVAQAANGLGEHRAADVVDDQAHAFAAGRLHHRVMEVRIAGVDGDVKP